MTEDEINLRCRAWTRVLYKMVSSDRFTDRGGYAERIRPLLDAMDELDAARYDAERERFRQLYRATVEFEKRTVPERPGAAPGDSVSGPGVPE